MAGSWRVYWINALLFGSGASALAYQMVWLRELRLVFGASTAASAAVLAIFMGGLGAGAAFLGRRIESHPAPLTTYARLELAISFIALVTPLLFGVVRWVYAGVGGSATLGVGGSTVARLLLAAVVIGPPTFLMGGTLPAAARALSTTADVGRRGLAMLYGINALGGVTGVLATTFVLLELLGARKTLLVACVLNVAVALLARRLSRASPTEDASTSEPAPVADAVAPAAWILAAAAAVGFAFFLLEIVWYRMLAPLLGGSTYTFGLILAVVLLGIGAGAWLYGARERPRQPTLTAFAITCSLEAALVALPLALGDRLAVLAGLLRPLGQVGFGGLVAGWVVIALIVVFPAAVAAGYQFPLLVALLGRGRPGLARDTGRAYAWNTVGSILGSLAGGFGLLPLLGALGLWRGVVLLLLATAVTAVVIAWRREPRHWVPVPVVLFLFCIVALAAVGPTAAWRHGAIGAGREDLSDKDATEIRRWMRARRRMLEWETDGVESNVAIEANNAGLAFSVGGKIDGNARLDAPTQVWTGLIPAVLHPGPERALVIGLGTGSTAGWLGQVPGIDRVDVVELEPAVLEMARRSAAVNHDVLDNPKVDVIIGDGREVLVTTHETYDVISSEPSNPYRAGIASLYTVEFYQAARERLEDGGIFAQWVQAYEIDAETVKTLYATMLSVFPWVETWQLCSTDMLLVASSTPIHADGVRERLATEPFASGLVDVLGVGSPEGFWAHFIGGPRLAVTLADVRPNTDDNMRIEYGFARTVGNTETGFELADLAKAAMRLGDHRSPRLDDAADLEAIDDNVAWIALREGVTIPDLPALVGERRLRAEAVKAFRDRKLVAAFDAWRNQSREPREPYELALVAAGLAERADPEALEVIGALRSTWPIEAELISAFYQWRLGEIDASLAHLTAGFERARVEPWCQPFMLDYALELAAEMVAQHPDTAERLAALLGEPWAARSRDVMRVNAWLGIVDELGCERVVEVFEGMEPNVPWFEHFLRRRWECYAETRHPLTAVAARELAELRAAAPSEL